VGKSTSSTSAVVELFALDFIHLGMVLLDFVKRRSKHQEFSLCSSRLIRCSLLGLGCELLEMGLIHVCKLLDLQLLPNEQSGHHLLGLAMARFLLLLRSTLVANLGKRMGLVHRFLVLVALHLLLTNLRTAIRHNPGVMTPCTTKQQDRQRFTSSY